MRLEACVLYGQGHYEDMSPQQYERLKDFMALAWKRHDDRIKEHNKMFGG